MFGGNIMKICGHFVRIKRNLQLLLFFLEYTLVAIRHEKLLTGNALICGTKKEKCASSRLLLN